ncbi:MAG: TonB-dependent receptor [Pseudomonadota bacterium]
MQPKKLLAAAVTAALGVTSVNAQVLEEIVVTAQKRSENLQDVPISIATLNNDTITTVLSGGADILALSARVPGLYVESSNGRVAPRFYVRGLGNIDFDNAASQPVSVIMDEVVMENVILKSFPLFDIEQVEVARGPQGTLFGRNTTAGLVKIDSRNPTQDFSADLGVTVGTLGTVIVEGGIGGGLSETVSGRVSFLANRRDDWIDNLFTGADDVEGGHEELALRAKLLFEPTDDLSALFTVRFRDLDGPASYFRANILDPGSNSLNQNFDRDGVYHDAGESIGDMEQWGFTAKIDYDLGDMMLTSITAYEDGKRTAFGDIDGGFGASFLPVEFPAPIPFPSATGGTADTDQFTQEVRLASDTAESFRWQAGFYYFQSDLEDVTDPGFVPPSTVVRDDELWALFAQGSWDLNDRATVTAGLRYTSDEKELTAFNNPGAPVPTTVLEDEELSGDISINYVVNEDVNVFARYARGFRGPSIQGRDIAFFGQPSTAPSEIIDSFEVGVKSQLLDNRLRANVTAYVYDIEDLQQTAVGGTGNNIQLVSAEGGAGYGIEADLLWAATENLSFTLGYAYNNTEIEDGNLLVPICGSGLCTPTDPLVQTEVGTVARVDGNPFPNAPRSTLNLTVDFIQPLSNGNEVFANLDYARTGRTEIFLYQTEEFNHSGNFEVGAEAGYSMNNGRYRFSVFGRNITNEENLIGGIDFNNNTGFVNEPRIWGVRFTGSFE